MADEYQVAQVVAEVLHAGEPAARVAGIYAEVLHAGVPQARIAGIYVEVLRSVESAGGSGRRRQALAF